MGAIIVFFQMLDEAAKFFARVLGISGIACCLFGGYKVLGETSKPEGSSTLVVVAGTIGIALGGC